MKKVFIKCYQKKNFFYLYIVNKIVLIIARIFLLHKHVQEITDTPNLTS